MARRCEVMTPTGWHEVAFADLTVGAVFRLFEEDGAPVSDENGETRWRARDLPIERDGVPWIDAEPAPESEVERQVRERGLFWPGAQTGYAPSRLR